MTTNERDVKRDRAVVKARGEKFHAHYEIDSDGVWLANVAEIPQVHTYASTLGKAREYLVDALALWLNSSVENVRLNLVHRPALLPNEVQAALDEALSARLIAETSTKLSNEFLTQAAIALVSEAHLSRRDAGELLGLSHQRVQQLVASPENSTSGVGTRSIAAHDIAERLKEFLPGGSKEDLGVLIGGVAVGLTLLWAANAE